MHEMHVKMYLYSVMYIFCMFLMPGHSPAQEKTGSGIPPEAQRLLTQSDIRTLCADFVQVRHLKIMSVPLESSGSLYFRKPDSVVWEVKKPAPSRLVISGGRALMEIPGLNHREVVDTAVDPVLKELAGHIVSIAAQDFKVMQQKYSMEFKPESTLILTPTDQQMKKAVSSIRIEFLSPGIIRKMTMNQPGGDSIEISFSSVRLNNKLPENIFNIDNG